MPPQRPILFGIHAGINVASMTDKSEGLSQTTSAKVGFSGGVDVTLRVSPSFSIQPELNFSQMGGQEKVNDPDLGNFTGKINLDYLSLPVLVKYTVPRTGFSIYVGPQIAYLLHSSISADNLSASATGYFNKPDFSGVFGIEYYCRMGFGIPAARYQLGFTNVYNATSGLSSDPNETMKNHGFTFTLGYRF